MSHLILQLALSKCRKKGASLVKSLFYRVLTTKGKEWEYESEYRLIVQEKELIPDEGVLKYEGLAPFLRGIIMGTQCDTKKEKFEQELKNNQCSKKFKSFRLDLIHEATESMLENART